MCDDDKFGSLEVWKFGSIVNEPISFEVWKFANLNYFAGANGKRAEELNDDRGVGRDELRGLSAACFQVRPLGVYAMKQMLRRRGGPIEVCRGWLST